MSNLMSNLMSNPIVSGENKQRPAAYFQPPALLIPAAKGTRTGRETGQDGTGRDRRADGTGDGRDRTGAGTGRDWPGRDGTDQVCPKLATCMHAKQAL